MEVLWRCGGVGVGDRMPTGRHGQHLPMPGPAQALSDGATFAVAPPSVLDGSLPRAGVAAGASCPAANPHNGVSTASPPAPHASRWTATDHGRGATCPGGSGG